jgi:nucleotide-binding universal stress UspA family protein
MTAAMTGLPAPGVRPTVSGPALVVIGDEVPDWVLSWCSRTAREVRRRPVPGRPGAAESADRVSAIADIAAGAARSGIAVLALPAAPQVRGAPPRVIAAVRQLPDDAQTLADAAMSAGHLGADLVVAHGLPASFGERSVGLDAAVRDAARLLDAAVDAAATSQPGLHVQGWLARVRPHELVGEQLDADLLVLGGPRADRYGQLGLVARSALFHAPCPVLLTPRFARSPSGVWAPTQRCEPVPIRSSGDLP